MKRFVTVFSIGLLIFALANIAAAIIRSDDPDAPDSTDRYGFPFLISAEVPTFSGGVRYHDDPNAYYSRGALWSDIAIAIIVSGLAASINTAYRIRSERIEVKI